MIRTPGAFELPLVAQLREVGQLVGTGDVAHGGEQRVLHEGTEQDVGTEFLRGRPDAREETREARASRREGAPGEPPLRELSLAPDPAFPNRLLVPGSEDLHGIFDVPPAFTLVSGVDYIRRGAGKGQTAQQRIQSIRVAGRGSATRPPLSRHAAATRSNTSARSGLSG